MFLCEKKQRNVRKNSEENVRKRRFPALSAGKKLFSKIGLGHVLSIPNTHLCAKNQKKLHEISRKCQKRFFRHISGIFGRKNTFLENQARSHFRHCHFASGCQISWKKYWVRLEKFKKYRFSGENRLFRPFLESSGNKNQFNWQMNHA